MERSKITHFDRVGFLHSHPEHLALSLALWGMGSPQKSRDIRDRARTLITEMHSMHVVPLDSVPDRFLILGLRRLKELGMVARTRSGNRWGFTEVGLRVVENLTPPVYAYM